MLSVFSDIKYTGLQHVRNKQGKNKIFSMSGNYHGVFKMLGDLFHLTHFRELSGNFCHGNLMLSKND